MPLVAITGAVTNAVSSRQFQRFDFGSVCTTSGFSAIESDSWEFIMVNFVNVDGLCGFRGLEDRTLAKARRRDSQKRPVFRVASSRFEWRCFVLLKTICSVQYSTVNGWPSVLGKTSSSPGLLNHHFQRKNAKNSACLPKPREKDDRLTRRIAYQTVIFRAELDWQK